MPVMISHLETPDLVDVLHLFHEQLERTAGLPAQPPLEHHHQLRLDRVWDMIGERDRHTRAALDPADPYDVYTQTRAVEKIGHDRLDRRCLRRLVHGEPSGSGPNIPAVFAMSYLQLQAGRSMHLAQQPLGECECGARIS